MTRVGSRKVVQISAGFMIFFSILGKFGADFASIPAPIIAALYCLFFAYVGSAGLGFLQFCNLNSFRTKFILGFSLFMGLSIPQYFNEYTAIRGYGPAHTRSRWKQFSELLMKAASDYSALTASVEDFQWTQNFKEPPSVWGGGIEGKMNCLPPEMMITWLRGFVSAKVMLIAFTCVNLTYHSCEI